jgi:hypothetical protein
MEHFLNDNIAENKGLELHKIKFRENWIILWIVLVFAGSISYCSKKSVEQQGTILAKVADRNITLSEFELRTEFTVRPKYPALNDDEIKRLCLNNLIAEKLLALEGQQERRLIDNPVFQAQMKGIKEQKMRDQLYFKEAVTAVDIDSTEIKNVFLLAGREYNISYYTIHNDSLADRIKNELKKNPERFDQLYQMYSSSDTLPHKIVTFKDPDPVVVNDSLFSKPLNVGQVIGPLKLDRNEYIVMRVNDWKYYPAISTSDVQNRYDDVHKKLKEKKSDHAWHEFTAGVMKGKRVEFEKDTFIKLSELFFEIYGTKDEAFKRKLFNEFLSDDMQEIRFDNGMFENIMLDHPFFTIDSKEWTVRDFRKAYMSHPLVFRYRATNLKDFQPEFRMAILSLIRDHFLTKEAYKRNLDEHPEVKSACTMWEDAIVAQYHRDQYLNQVRQREDFNPDLLKGKHNYVSIYVDSLQKKYKNKITINISELNKIKLTNIDLLVTIPGAPYPIAVPGFPEYTQDSEIVSARHDPDN